jgi:putative DNA primase/helicase
MTDEITKADSPFSKDEIKSFPFDIPKDAPPRFFENDLDENELRATFIKSKVEGTYRLAEYITKKFDIITVGESKLEMFVYRDGMYFQSVNEIIYPEIQRILGAFTTGAAKVETFGKIAGMTMRSRSVFTDAPETLIPLANGVYDRTTRSLLPHDPKYRFTFQFPIIYDANASCPLTSAFMETIFDEDQRKLVQEWLGYFFLRNYMFKKAIIFVGEGNTGKTTLLEVIDHLIGKDNVSSVTLQKMSGDKFAAAHLYGKHANLVDELSAKDVSDTGNFKIATGGGSIAGEYKFGNQFLFHNFSKLTFACNKIPDVKDFDDDAYFNRWMVVRFENTIATKIPNFVKTLTTESERSGLFNLAMVGLDRLLEQGGFSYSKNALDTKKEMMRSSSSVAQFVAERLEQENGAEITKEDLYDTYSNYCADKGLPAETIKFFGQRLQNYATYVTEGLMTVPGKSRMRGWRNVVVKSVDQTADEAFDAYEPTEAKFDIL